MGCDLPLLTYDKRFFQQFQANGLIVNDPRSKFSVCDACYGNCRDALLKLRSLQLPFDAFNEPVSLKSKSSVHYNNGVMFQLLSSSDNEKKVSLVSSI
jgi:hypothetical protein